MLKIKWYKTTFFRFVILFCILFIPLILMAIFMYQKALSYIEQYTMDSEKNRGLEYLLNLEDEVERIKMTQMDMLRDEDIWQLSLHPYTNTGYADLLAIRRIQQRLRSSMLGSSFIEDFRAHIYPMQKTISAISGLDDMARLFDQNVIVPAGTYGAQLVQTEDRYSFTARRENQAQLLFDIEVVLDKEKIAKSLMPLSMDNNTTVILLFGEHLSVVSYLGDEQFTQPEFLQGLETKIGAANFEEVLRINGGRYLVSHTYSKYLDMVLLQIVPYDALLEPLDEFYSLLWLYVAIVILVIFIFVRLAYQYFKKPLEQMVGAFYQAEKGDLSTRVEIKGDTEFTYLGKRFNSMVESIRTLVDKNLKQELMLRNAEYKQLQAQIHPHFLYNSFYILSRLIKMEDLDKASRMASGLGKYFRYVTYNAQDDVPLKDEWDHAATYAEIMRIRFSHSIQIEIGDLPEIAWQIKVPRLILQPLIENIFEHGIRNMETGAYVAMSACQDNGDICIRVYDNGVGMDANRAQEIINATEPGQYNEITGLENIHRRLKHMFGDAYGLTFLTSDQPGTLVELRIPMQENS